MSRRESLKSIETGLRGCRDLSSSLGENALAYMIDMAISEAREYSARDREQSQVGWARASARVMPFARVKTIKAEMTIKAG